MFQKNFLENSEQTIDVYLGSIQIIRDTFLAIFWAPTSSMLCNIF